ncbi:hypothetical protein HELRODRAFT_174436 [Helobdella robusta]|uniref:Uncharacterized protein n=1 Tax=Helobdella robusta TaxID=6412 RepID=T1F845_HELRO|nr:hypothetical protein HELRODRAFT_174436 [Helobdella robusta]ESO01488.1 hypothetical protein HELRODRAFT_174436 [Helobdella robusta]
MNACQSARFRGKMTKFLERSPLQIAMCVLVLVDAGVVVTEILLDLHAIKSKQKAAIDSLDMAMDFIWDRYPNELAGKLACMYVCDTIRYDTTPFDTIRRHSIRYDTIRYDTIQIFLTLTGYESHSVQSTLKHLIGTFHNTDNISYHTYINYKHNKHNGSYDCQFCYNTCNNNNNNKNAYLSIYQPHDKLDYSLYNKTFFGDDKNYTNFNISFICNNVCFNANNNNNKIDNDSNDSNYKIKNISTDKTLYNNRNLNNKTLNNNNNNDNDSNNETLKNNNINKSLFSRTIIQKRSVLYKISSKLNKATFEGSHSNFLSPTNYKEPRNSGKKQVDPINKHTSLKLSTLKRKSTTTTNNNNNNNNKYIHNINKYINKRIHKNSNDKISINNIDRNNSSNDNFYQDNNNDKQMVDKSQEHINNNNKNINDNNNNKNKLFNIFYDNKQGSIDSEHKTLVKRSPPDAKNNADEETNIHNNNNNSYDNNNNNNINDNNNNLHFVFVDENGAKNKENVQYNKITKDKSSNTNNINHNNSTAENNSNNNNKNNVNNDSDNNKNDSNNININTDKRSNNNNNNNIDNNNNNNNIDNNNNNINTLDNVNNDDATTTTTTTDDRDSDYSSATKQHFVYDSHSEKLIKIIHMLHYASIFILGIFVIQVVHPTNHTLFLFLFVPFFSYPKFTDT